jgi:hypothetical protein
MIGEAGQGSPERALTDTCESLWHQMTRMADQWALEYRPIGCVRGIRVA